MSWSLIDQREEINKKSLGTRSERVKKQLRAKYVEKEREVKRSIETERNGWRTSPMRRRKLEETNA